MRSSGAKIGAAALVLAAAIILSLQFFAPVADTPVDGDACDDGARSLGAAYTISLDAPAASGTGWTYTGTTLTFNTAANGNDYLITQTGAAAITRNITVQAGVDTAVTISGLNITGNISLSGVSPGAVLDLSINGANRINGSILVPAGAEITIESATGVNANDTLTVIADSSSNNAGIGGAGAMMGAAGTVGKITILGGTISATGGTNTLGMMAGGAGIGGGGTAFSGTAGGGGTVIIGGGIVTATGNRGGAGIGGGGADGTAGTGGTVTITGGNVTAAGADGGAGIGGGANSGVARGGSGGIVNISGGIVNATGSVRTSGGGGGGAGIGGGASGGHGGTVTIEGGDVRATGMGGGSGIGGAGVLGGDGGIANIIGGTVTATGSRGGAGIGGGSGSPTNPGAGGNITIGGDAYVTATSLSAGGSEAGAGIGGGVSGNGGVIWITGTSAVYAYSDSGAAIGGGNGASGGTITIDDHAYVFADARSTTAHSSAAGIGGAATSATGGIITIKDNARVDAFGGRGGGAGIGGGTGGGGTILIQDNAAVTALGGTGLSEGFGGAGIGGGFHAAGGNITITGGTVTATGQNGGAGIGGGGGAGVSSPGSGGTITISGGIVYAQGSHNSAGIGGGSSPDHAGAGGGTVTINGGFVTAVGSGRGSGIGGAGGSNPTNPGAGATFTILAAAELRAYSRGELPAVHASSIGPGTTGFFVNALLDAPVSTAAVTTLYVESYTSDPHGPGTGSAKITLDQPANYRGYAFQISAEASSSVDYAMHIDIGGGKLRCIVHLDESGHADDAYHILQSINSPGGYGAHNTSSFIALLPVKLEGVWEVTFDLMGGTASGPFANPQEVPKHGNLAEEPSVTFTNGTYIFAGWFKESAYTNEWDFATDTVDGNVTLYAKWLEPCDCVNFCPCGGCLDCLGLGCGKYGCSCVACDHCDCVNFCPCGGCLDCLGATCGKYGCVCVACDHCDCVNFCPCGGCLDCLGSTCGKYGCVCVACDHCDCTNTCPCGGCLDCLGSTCGKYGCSCVACDHCDCVNFCPCGGCLDCLGATCGKYGCVCVACVHCDCTNTCPCGGCLDCLGLGCGKYGCSCVACDHCDCSDVCAICGGCYDCGLCGKYGCVCTACTCVTVTVVSTPGKVFTYTLNGIDGTDSPFTMPPSGSYKIKMAFGTHFEITAEEVAGWSLNGGPELRTVTYICNSVDADITITASFDDTGDPVTPPTPIPWVLIMVIGFAAIFLFFIILDDDEEEIYGKVTKDGKGVAGVKISYTINGESRVTTTDKDGDYAITALGDDVVVITEASKGDSSVWDLPPEIKMEKESVKVDLEL